MATNSTITPTVFTIPQKGEKILAEHKIDSNTQLLEAITKLQQYSANVDNCGNCAASNCCQSCQRQCDCNNCSNCSSYSH